MSDPQAQEVPAPATAGIQVEFDRMTDPEFRDLLAQTKHVVDEIQAGQHDTALRQLGVSPDAGKTLDAHDFVVQRGHQLTGLEIALILIVAREGSKFGGKVVTDIWSTLILPRLQAVYGKRIRAQAASPG